MHCEQFCFYTFLTELMMVGIIGLMINMSESIGLFHILYSWSGAFLKLIGLQGHKYPESEESGMRFFFNFDLP